MERHRSHLLARAKRELAEARVNEAQAELDLGASSQAGSVGRLTDVRSEGGTSARARRRDDTAAPLIQLDEVAEEPPTTTRDPSDLLGVRAPARGTPPLGVCAPAREAPPPDGHASARGMSSTDVRAPARETTSDVRAPARETTSTDVYAPAREIASVSVAPARENTDLWCSPQEGHQSLLSQPILPQDQQ